MNQGAGLLLDIDGVLVHEAEHANGRTGEILLLHKNAAACLERLYGQVFVVTHRSQLEARQILACAGLSRPKIACCFAADDIFQAALKRSRVTSLMRHGLRKSLILPELAERYGIVPGRLCFVDDRPENIQDMLRAGVGVGMLAPTGHDGANSLITFDFQEVIDGFIAWAASLDDGGDDTAGQMCKLGVRHQRIEDWCRTGVSTRSSARSIFNYGRRLGRMIRRVF